LAYEPGTDERVGPRLDAGALLLPSLVARLAGAPYGVGFVYDCLDEILDRFGLRDAVLVVHDEPLGRQAFRAGRRPLESGWARDVALRGRPGLHTEPAAVDHAHELAALA